MISIILAEVVLTNQCEVDQVIGFVKSASQLHSKNDNCELEGTKQQTHDSVTM